MSNHPEGHLWGTGDDLRSVATAALATIDALGWSPFNPTYRTIEFCDGLGERRSLPDLDAARAALSEGGLITIWSGDDDADLMIHARGNIGPGLAGADFEITLTHVSFAASDGSAQLARFVALWLELARRIDLVVGCLTTEIAVEVLGRNDDDSTGYRRFIEGRISTDTPVAAVWDPTRWTVDPRGGDAWSDGSLAGRVYQDTWYDVPVRPLLVPSHERT
jgi:hypothetical protein